MKASSQKRLKQLQNFKAKIDRELKKFLQQKKKEVHQSLPQSLPLVKAVADLTLRSGKRIRPAMMYYGYLATGGKNKKAVLFASQSTELLHTWALIHDDIIDQSDLRRGGPAVHKILGQDGAVLAGDLSFNLAEEILDRSDFPPQNKIKARQIFDLLKEEVILGQYLDVLAEKKENLTEKEILTILEYKTARYTLVRPLQMGVALAGANKKSFNVFKRFGLPLGVAFQIQDDILGVFGNQKQTGKPIDLDLKQGKKTLLIIKALEKLKPKEKQRFLSIFGNQKATAHDLSWLRDKIKETSALFYSQKLARKLINQAKQAIVDYPMSKEAQDFLISIADYMLAREK